MKAPAAWAAQVFAGRSGRKGLLPVILHKLKLRYENWRYISERIQRTKSRTVSRHLRSARLHGATIQARTEQKMGSLYDTEYHSPAAVLTC